MIRRRGSTLLLFAVLVCAATATWCDPPVASDDDPVQVSLLADRAGKPKEGVGSGLIAAPPERVFRAVTDLAHWHEFMPFMTASDAAPQSDGSVLSEQRLDLPFPLGKKHYRVRFRSRVESTPAGPIWRADWSYVPASGNLVDLHGAWTLAAAGPSATLATCHLYTDPGSSLSAGLMDRATEKSLRWIFKGLRQQVRRSRYDLDR